DGLAGWYGWKWAGGLELIEVGGSLRPGGHHGVEASPFLLREVHERVERKAHTEVAEGPLDEGQGAGEVGAVHVVGDLGPDPDAAHPPLRQGDLDDVEGGCRHLHVL